MKNSFKHSASIEQFLSGEMLPAERLSFEREVARNPELAGELNLSRTIDEALRRDDIIDFRKKLLVAFKDNKKAPQETPVIQLNIRRLWYAAASFLLLAGLGATLYFSVPRGNPNDTIFKEYYSADNLVDVTRAGDVNIVEAVIKFQEKDYVMAAKLFHNIVERDNGNIACWFYYGISSIENENYDQAEKAFNYIITNDQNLYVEHAQWYLGLCFLKHNQVKKATEQFKSIAADPDNYHQKDAIRILRKLD
ncbi:MAG: tetratricopeptide repeat protein [Bacteroidetes bacterium]|nr:tetratricopeptide repeat protein [Bacteroidota bacterium]